MGWTWIGDSIGGIIQEWGLSQVVTKWVTPNIIQIQLNGPIRVRSSCPPNMPAGFIGLIVGFSQRSRGHPFLVSAHLLCRVNLHLIHFKLSRGPCTRIWVFVFATIPPKLHVLMSLKSTSPAQFGGSKPNMTGPVWVSFADSRAMSLPFLVKFVLASQPLLTEKCHVLYQSYCAFILYLVFRHKMIGGNSWGP